MSLVTTKELMLDAQKNHYAIGAFNAENMEMVQAIIAAAEELRAPVIVQTTPGTLKYASPAMFHAMVAAAASEASVPVVMHLDHGSSYELAMQAFRAGYTSVMIDGSHHVFEENIEITKSVVRACHAAGIPVEAELGKVGGKEDDLDGGNGNGYTVPSEAAEFAERHRHCPRRLQGNAQAGHRAPERDPQGRVCASGAPRHLRRARRCRP